MLYLQESSSGRAEQSTSRTRADVRVGMSSWDLLQKSEAGGWTAATLACCLPNWAFMATSLWSDRGNVLSWRVADCSAVGAHRPKAEFRPALQLASFGTAGADRRRSEAVAHSPFSDEAKPYKLKYRDRRLGFAPAKSSVGPAIHRRGLCFGKPNAGLFPTSERRSEQRRWSRFVRSPRW